MILSAWRYAHLGLALVSGAFLVLLSVTGAILAFEPIDAQLQGVPQADVDPELTVSEFVDRAGSSFTEIAEARVDNQGLLTITAFDEHGDFGTFYIDPRTGQNLGPTREPSTVFQFSRNLHRSLFLKSTGRILVGVNSFLLLIIALTGSVLLWRRQQGLKGLFKKVDADSSAPRVHVQLARIFLIPLFIVATSGVYLSLYRFSVIADVEVNHVISDDVLAEGTAMSPRDFLAFQNLKLADVRFIEFPFSDFPDEYFKVGTDQEEYLISQVTGQSVNTESYDLRNRLTYWSAVLHTGQGSPWWAVVLGITCVAVLVFMYTGFAVTVRRRSARFKSFSAGDSAEIVILAGSENGTTMQFAKYLAEKLTAAGEMVHVAQLNHVSEYPKMRRLVVLAATYGQGEPPSNAKLFFDRASQLVKTQPIEYSVVGFGSKSYPFFCKYAEDVDNFLDEKEYMSRQLKLVKVNNRSWETFRNWAKAWAESSAIDLDLPVLSPFPVDKRFLVNLRVTQSQRVGPTVLLELEGLSTHQVLSGDLLAIQPPDKSYERYYSLGQKGDKTLLAVRVHEGGVCSPYLGSLQKGDRLKARLVSNTSFHLPPNASEYILVSNGTGIGPFLGMIEETDVSKSVKLYWGGKSRESFDLYKPELDASKRSGLNVKTAFSKDDSYPFKYVQELLHEDSEELRMAVSRGAVILICGSLKMQEGVIDTLNSVLEKESTGVEELKLEGRLLYDCY